MSWVDFVQTKILGPLGMVNSITTCSNLPKDANLALPHDSAGDQIKQLSTFEGDLLAAAGGIYASVEDLCQWMLLQLNGGKYGQGLSKELFFH